MSSSVDVAGLVDRPMALARCAEEARTASGDADSEIGTTQTWLVERLTHWRLIVRRCQAQVTELTSALRRYQSTDGACCDETERALREAQIQLRAAQEQIARARQWAPAIAEAARVDDREA